MVDEANLYPASFYKEVGRLVQKSRKARGMTQEILASRIGLTRTSVTNIEQGQQKFLLHTLIDIAQALHIAPASLLPEIYETSEEQINAMLKNHLPDEAEFIRTGLAVKREDG